MLGGGGTDWVFEHSVNHLKKIELVSYFKTVALPSMLEKNQKRQTLSSVECFAMGGSTWGYLPAMNKARWLAVADVLPSTGKYVYKLHTTSF